MVRTTREIINKLKCTFDYVDGILLWKRGHKLFGKSVGCKRIDNYIDINLNFGFKENIKLLTHRAIFAMHFNYFPDLVDHIDQNPSNNKIENLRDATKKINAINTGIPSNNSSGIKGVSFEKGSYVAYIHSNHEGYRKKYHLGRFKNIEDARQARNKGEEFFWTNI